MTGFLAFVSDEGGASAAEYALILAIIGGALAIAALTMGSAIGGAMSEAASCIDGSTC